jgi:hypothetical protein
MNDDMLKAFENHILETRAIDAAWRQIQRSTASAITLAPFVERVVTKCPGADADYVRRELKRQLEHYWPRPRRKTARLTSAKITDPNHSNAKRLKGCKKEPDPHDDEASP